MREGARTTISSFLSVLLLLLMVSVPASGQESECSKDNLDACDVSLNVYCLADRSGVLTMGITENADLGFDVVFNKKAPSRKLKLIAVDGVVEKGAVNEFRLTTLNCTGKSCSGVYPGIAESIERLQSEFNIDQNVVNFVLRDRGRDLCIGKFTNNPDKVAEASDLERAVCEFVPAEGYETLSGSGYFDSAGFGDGSFFHLSLQQFPVGQRYTGCSVIGEGRYRKVLEFQSYDQDSTDDEIYGTLSDAEREIFESKLFEYSYDLLRQLLGEGSSDAGLDLRFGFTPSLSAINKGVTPSRGSKAIKSSNKKSSRKRARKRRRKKKKNAKRSLRSRAVAAASDRALRVSGDNEDVLAWLNFDPSGGTIYLAPNCYGDGVPAKAYGQLLCGEDAESEARKCIALSPSGDQAGEARVCLETRESFGIFNIRAKELETGTYQICFDSEQSGQTIAVGALETAEQNLTDSTLLAERVSAYEQIGVSPGEVEQIGLSLSGDCSAPDFTGNL